MVLGEHHLVDKEVFEQNRGVEAIYLHPRYKSMFFEGIYDTPPDFDVGKLHSVVLKNSLNHDQERYSVFVFKQII